MNQQYNPNGGGPPNERPMSMREQVMHEALQRALMEIERLERTSREETTRFIADIARLQVRNAQLERAHRQNNSTERSIDETAALGISHNQALSMSSREPATPPSRNLAGYTRDLQDALARVKEKVERLETRNTELEAEHSQKSHADLLRDEAAKVLRQLYSGLEGITDASIQRGNEPGNTNHIEEAVDRLALVWFDSDANDKIHEILLDQFKDLEHNEQQGQCKFDHVERLRLILTACKTKGKGLPQHGRERIEGEEPQPNLNDFLRQCEQILIRWANWNIH